MADDENRARGAKTLPFILLVLFFDAMGVGLILPVLPDLIKGFGGLANSDAASISGYLLFTFAAMQFVCAPILGGLSDRFGRRPILLLALAGYSADYFLMAFAPSIFWLFIARAVSGICGATFAAANAAIVDISSEGERARHFGLTGAAVGLGFVFGPVIGGLIGEYAVRAPFIVAGVLTLLTTIYGAIAFKETLPPEKRRRFTLARANPIGGLLAMRHYPLVPLFLAVLFCVQLASQSYNSIWSFYTIAVADWTPFWIGTSAGLYGLLLAIVQGGLTGPFIARVGEPRAAMFSFIVGVGVYLGLGFASSGPMIYAMIVLGAFSGFAFPAIQAMMTARTPADAQGELQGAVASLFSLSAIIGPILMTQLFSAYTNEIGIYFPGAGFIASAIIIVIAIIIAGPACRRAAT